MSNKEMINNERKKDKNRNRINKGWILLLGFLLLMVGIILTIGSILIQILFSSNWLTDCIKSTILTLGQVLISISATAILFEHFGYVDYAVKRLRDVLTRDDVIATLSTDKKKEFKSKITKDLYLFGDTDENSLELISLLDNDMDQILSDYYYSEHITYVDFFVRKIEGEKYFYKIIRRTFTAKPIKYGKTCKLDGILFLRTKAIGENENSKIKNITISKLKINGKEISKYDYSCDGEKKLVDGDHYDIEYILKINKEELITFNESCDIDISYETYTKYSDKIYAVTVDRPCRHFCCHFNIDTSKYDITLKGNGFMCYKNQQRKREIKTYNGKMLRFLSWILPGDGVVSVINEKKQNNKNENLY